MSSSAQCFRRERNTKLLIAEILLNVCILESVPTHGDVYNHCISGDMIARASKLRSTIGTASLARLYVVKPQEARLTLPMVNDRDLIL